ncbi:PAS domain S-box protein [Natrinema zhouii]|nr:PAS domain S-box protein [Natrinema zhouii]QLK24456.2 PAS domain S-box protein [Natrinema zhouii]
MVAGIIPSEFTVLGINTATEPGLLVAGLAARDDAGGPNDLERLTDELRQFLSRLEDDPAPLEVNHTDSPADPVAAVDFEIDRDDEVGRLAEAIEDLTETMCDRERRRAESERDRRDLYRITSDPDCRGETKIRRLLEFGCDRLGLETGLLSRIDESTERYEVETAVGNEAELEGSVLDLSTIYCRETITSDDILGIHDAAATGREDHPAADELGVSCYLGGKIVVEGELYGTLCFLNRDPRDRPFTAAETSFVDLMTRWVSQAIERRTDVRRIEEREQRLERAQQFTDDMLDAVDDVVYLIDEDGEVRRWNESLCEATGYVDTEIESMHALDFFDEPDRDRITNAIDEVLETGSARIDAPLVTSDGRRIPYEFVGSTLENPAGDPLIAGVGRDVSERRDKERRLERYEQFTNDVLDALDDVFYVLDEEGAFQRWNETLVEVSGYTDAEIESMHALDFFDEENRTAIRDSIEEAFETGETHIEAALQTKSGERIPYEFIASVLEDPDGRPVEVGIGRDITERRDKERRLRERETRLERTTHLLEQSQRLAKIGAWELDVTEEPYEPWWTDEVRRIHGVSSDEAVDIEQALGFYHPDDRPRIREAVERAIEDGEPYDLELRITTDDGDRRWVRAIGEPVFESGAEYCSADGRLQSGDGDVVKVRGSFQDITERKERERELERTETIIQALDELVYTIDADGRFQFLNDALTPITGYEPEELIGERVSTVMAEGDLETARDRIRDLLRADEPSRTFEMALETDHGDVLDAESHMALLPMTDGEFAGTAGVIRDITERKERERELERTTELLEQAERLAGIGGWELDVSDEPGEITLTDGLRRLYELSPDADVTQEQASSFPHPDDRAAVLDVVNTAMVDGDSYEIEHRMQTAEGNERWVRSIGEPIRADGERRRSEGDRRAVGDTVDDPADGRPQSDIDEPRPPSDEIVGVRGTIQDITESKEQELALESLHDTARDLLGTDTEREVAELVVETAAEILEASGVAVYGLNPDVNRFDPIASTDEFATLCNGDDAPSVAVGDDNSVLWNAYVTETGTVIDDPAAFDRSQVFGPAVESGVVVPIGDHGVFAIASGERAIDAEGRRLIETLVATTEAAFDRLESEASLREREAELEERNRRLNRQIEITELIRRIDQSLIGADSRAEIERTVPERLIEADDVAFAWIGQPDASGTRLEPRAWAGSGQEYLDDVSLEYDASAEPAVRTARTETPTVVSNVVEGLQGDPWRRRAVDRGFQSVISVPLSHAEYSAGVLTVYAREPDAFGDLERTVMTELGEGIANAINAVKTREALHAETLLELTLRIEGSEDLLSRIAAKTGARVEYAGLGTHSGNETLLFFETSGVPPDDVRRVLDDLVSVTESRLISEADGDCRFEATVTGSVIASRLVRHGGSPRSMRADAAGTEITVDVPPGTDVREFIEMVREGYPTVELRSRRHVERSMGTRSELVTSLFDALTDRQLEVLRTAYFAGFFEWPRESTGEEIAELLAVTQPTVNRHLRIGQQRLLAQLFEDERPISAE